MAYGRRRRSYRGKRVRSMGISALYRASRKSSASAKKSKFRKPCSKLVRKSESFKTVYGPRAAKWSGVAPPVYRVPKAGGVMLVVRKGDNTTMGRIFKGNEFEKMVRYTMRFPRDSTFSVFDHRGNVRSATVAAVNQGVVARLAQIADGSVNAPVGALPTLPNE